MIKKSCLYLDFYCTLLCKMTCIVRGNVVDYEAFLNVGMQ